MNAKTNKAKDAFIEQYFEPIKALFFRYGIKSVSMDDICKELGVSKRTLYVYFENKSQLVHEIFYRDFYLFKKCLKDIPFEYSNAMLISYELFKRIDRKHKEIDASALLDLKKYYNSIDKKIHQMMHQLIVSSFLEAFQRGKCEGYFRENMDEKTTAGIITYLFKVALYHSPDFTLEGFLDYHFHSICSDKGMMQWQKLNSLS